MRRPSKFLLALGALLALSGCSYDILSPSGWVADQQRNLLIISTLLMLIVIIPVLVMAVWFPLRYRDGRDDQSDYLPEFAHSNRLEVLIWGVPILIVIALGAYTWIYTHRLDPYRPLDHLAAGEPIEVEAVSLDWKWLFIYPDQGIATVNELVIPTGHPVNFSLSSSTVMNTLSIPALGGMVYAMTGMETKLHLIADEEGTFAGRSAHFSGPGYSQMTFDTRAVAPEAFDAWVDETRAADGEALTREAYLALERPTIDEPVRSYPEVEDGLFDRIVGMCVETGKVCMGEMMMQDEMGGGGLAGIGNAGAYSYDRSRTIDGFGNLVDLPPLPEAEAFHEAFLFNPDDICSTEETANG